MRQKLNALSFFLTAFIISAAVTVSIALIASYDGKVGGFDIDLQSGYIKIMGNEYVLDERAAEILYSLADFNRIFMGGKAFDAAKGAAELMISIAASLIRVVFGAVYSIVNASVI